MAFKIILFIWDVYFWYISSVTNISWSANQTRSEWRMRIRRSSPTAGTMSSFVFFVGIRMTRVSIHSNFFMTRPFKPEFRYNTVEASFPLSILSVYMTLVVKLLLYVITLITTISVFYWGSSVYSLCVIVSKYLGNIAFAHVPVCSKTQARMQESANRRRDESAHCLLLTLVEPLVDLNAMKIPALSVIAHCRSLELALKHSMVKLIGPISGSVCQCRGSFVN